jgi:methionyl-tRNA synthetase
MASKRYYITTPIYYVNAKPHIGTALTTLAADINARYERMRGRDVMFLTGTDENAPKVAEAAARTGKPTQQFVDEVADEFRTIWAGMNVRYDDFIRTTEERHKTVVHEVFRRLHERGDIYEGDYEGWYCVSCETFWRPAEVEDGLCPNDECRRSVNWVTEKNYFFRLSAYSDRLSAHINENPGFIVPEVRRNEVLRFIRDGLRDACITRANTGWGIPVPGDEGKVLYVWFDALINYLSAIGWPDKRADGFWPADVQWMGKDILVRFHATLWPAMLIGLGLPLPKTLVGHGWMTFGGEKISKSRGNIVEPVQLARELSALCGCSQDVAVDAVRYDMAREMPYASDSMFTQEGFEARYNADLANDLGNAIHRSVDMTHKFMDGLVPDADPDPAFVAGLQKHVQAYEAAMSQFRIDLAAEAVLAIASSLNRYIAETEPWSLSKKGDTAALHAVLRTLLETGRVAATLLSPIMPSAAAHIHRQVGYASEGKWDEATRLDLLTPGAKLPTPSPVFPRIPPQKLAKPEEPKIQTTPEISIGDFQKITLRVAEVTACEKVEGSDKLLKLTVRIGEEERQLAAGLGETHAPGDLVGKLIVVVTNLKPATIRGVLSQGMLLAAEDATGKPVLLTTEGPVPSGAKIH